MKFDNKPGELFSDYIAREILKSIDKSSHVAHHICVFLLAKRADNRGFFQLITALSPSPHLIKRVS